jgi:hypothetical protein
VAGIRRRDRKAFWYPKRCAECGMKWLSETKEARLRAAATDKAAYLLPLGTRRHHNSGAGLVYWEIKVAHPNEWMYEHRFLMGEKLGRRLLRSEHVHHENEDTLDNSLENLILLDAADHTREHLALNGRWSVKFICCIDCATTSKRHVGHGRCTACYQRWQARIRGRWR